MGEREERGVQYGSFIIIHSNGTRGRRLDDGFTVLRPTANGGASTVHVGPATDAVYERESQALIAAHARGKAWIDAEMSKSD